MISPERLDALQGNWVRLLDRLGVAPAAAYPSFDRLVEAYSAPERHYHNLEHLTEMFRVVGRLSSLVEDPVAVNLAIWFHDAVYDPRAKDNEERSADLADELLAPLAVPATTIERVKRLVRATAHLVASKPPVDRETAALLDADLAILGAAEERYRRYANEIRKEYAFVTDGEYRAGRAAVLTLFLARPRIFRCPLMIEEGETRARENMESELATLC